MDASALVATRRFALIEVRKEVHKSPQRGCEVGKLEPPPPLLTVITMVGRCAIVLASVNPLYLVEIALRRPAVVEVEWLALAPGRGAVGTGFWRVDSVGVIGRVRSCA
jgi:hypothetical protein